ncbi:transcriptional regulator, ArsR family [Cohaesibacter sp. ES.047]|uniref:ArsR/SmtB family transcription factor n=1 Tax=Cohaesibacter sp. ES.047 TaxID=1798205 RepID=UPI000BB7485B|nr:helix-turn-helix domain-containing protein [Cohaesibacter sp. ES.047]SNY90321.1 transcriptional regulator, ArsR family [Cohaesibacter sp. ES.047]
METNDAANIFASLSQPTRLDVFRLLIKAGPEGMSSGDLGEHLGVKPNTMSVNLKQLLHSGLVRNQRHGRQIYYYADMNAVGGLLSYLLQDCCGGRPELCDAVINEVACSC